MSLLGTAFAVVLLEGFGTIVGEAPLFGVPFTSQVRHVAVMADCQGEHHLPIRPEYFYRREVFPNTGSLSIRSIRLTFAVHFIELVII